jgi:MerR family redox-sensitive transcriptional activator SoxR
VAIFFRQCHTSSALEVKRNEEILMKAQDFSIGAVAQAAGVSPSALRYYESVGLIPAPERRSGRRAYDESVFPYLAAIRLAQDSGFTVAEIKELIESCVTPSAAKSREWKRLAARKIEEMERTIARAQAMKQLLGQWLDCECVSLEDCELIAGRSRRVPHNAGNAVPSTASRSADTPEIGKPA